MLKLNNELLLCINISEGSRSRLTFDMIVYNGQTEDLVQQQLHVMTLKK